MSGSSARSNPQSRPPTSTLNHGLPPPDFVPTIKPSHVTPNLPVVEDSDSQSESNAVPHISCLSPIRRTSYGTHAMQSLNTHRTFSPRSQTPFTPQRTPSERVIVALTLNSKNYVAADLTGQADAQAIREYIFNKLHIPNNLHSTYAIYRTELGGFLIGDALDNDCLLIGYLCFGDDQATLKFLVQCVNVPMEDANMHVLSYANATSPGRPSAPSVRSEMRNR